MKTSILISSFAALCLLVTFAEAPRRHGGDKINSASADNITIAKVMRATMLPGVTVTANIKKESGITHPVIPAEDFSYLKFNAAEYMEPDANYTEEAEILPEAIETDFTYLKFDVNDYITGPEMVVSELPELPDEYATAPVVFEPAPSVKTYEYLRFDVNGYMNSNVTTEEGFGELPLAEKKTADQVETNQPMGKINEFGYLKFDVTKFYRADSLNSIVAFELPEE